MAFKSVEGETSAELRQNYLREGFAPTAAAIFAKYDNVQSVVLAIGQFWADEAEDAVHLDVIPCVVADPVWPSCLDNNEQFAESDEGHHYLTYPRELYELEGQFPGLDDNTDAITAFASCCHEISSQEEPITVTSRPYAIARRTDTGEVDVEVVGTVLRPDWEDIFDLVESDDGTNDPRRKLIDAAYEQVGQEPRSFGQGGAAASTSFTAPGSSSAKSKPSIWKRLFGGGS